MRHDVHDVAGSMLRGSSAVKINKLAIFGAARHRCKRDSGIFASAPDVSMSGLGTLICSEPGTGHHQDRLVQRKG